MEIRLTKADFAAMKILSAVSDGMLDTQEFSDETTSVSDESMNQIHSLCAYFDDDSSLWIELSILNEDTTAYHRMYEQRRQEKERQTSSDAPDPAKSEVQ